VRSEDRRVLGVFPTRRWPANDAAHESAVREALSTSLRLGATTEPRTGALVSLLVALDAVHKVVPPDSVGLTKKELKGNARRIAEGAWAAKAVRKAIESMNAAVVAATTSAVAAGSVAGSS
jgi:hypothetical protein